MKSSTLIALTLFLAFSCAPSSPTPVPPRPSASPFSLPSASVLPTPPISPSSIAPLTPSPNSPQLKYLELDGMVSSPLIKIGQGEEAYLSWYNVNHLLSFLKGNELFSFDTPQKLTQFHSIAASLNFATQSLILIGDQTWAPPDYFHPVDTLVMGLKEKNRGEDFLLKGKRPHAIQLDQAGNGFIVLSDEYPVYNQAIVSVPNVKVYRVKVQNFVLETPQVLFETQVSNKSGASVVYAATLQSDGSGFFVAHDRMHVYLYAFQANQNAQKVTRVTQTNTRFFKFIKGKSKTFLLHSERKEPESPFKDPYSVLVIKELSDKGFADTFEYDIQNFKGGSSIRTYSTQPFDLELDDQGNGWMAYAKVDTTNMNDLLVVRQITGFKVQATREFVYPQHKSLLDLKLTRHNGEDVVTMIEGPCSDQIRCTRFDTDKEVLPLSRLNLTELGW